MDTSIIFDVVANLIFILLIPIGIIGLVYFRKLFIKTIKLAILKPVILIPVLISLLFGRLLSQLTAGAWLTMLETMLLWQSTSESPFLGLVLNKPIDIFVIIIAAIVGLIISVIAMEFLARIVKGQKIMEAVNDAVVDWNKALAISITLSIAVVIFVAIGLFIVEVGAVSELLSSILMIIYTAIFFFAIFKLAFIFPAMIGEKKAKGALQVSWGFVDTYSKFGKVLVYFAGIFIGVFVIEFVILSIGTLLLQSGITDELILEYILPIIGETIITTFAGLAIASYFFNK